ncbi:MAG: NifB/NifX family molybdenum-iron cluster-binding protein [Deltaproteobacteria bacterium]|nr:NifB/NifX family molybdenum-iron cluster-binding protein [Deltaproteobacteria bacterium]
MKNTLAVPSVFPGGLEAGLSPHFGHCDVFTVVDIVDGQVGQVAVIPNQEHETGGCLAPVNILAQRGVDSLVSGGMGMRPLMGFMQAGIEVYHNAGHFQVGPAVKAFAAGLLPKFGQNMTCGGHGPGGCGGH